MKALILAAGFGSRLLPKTKNIPKCLVKVHNKPILEYQLEALIANNINHIIIVVGYQGMKVKQFIKNNPQFRNLKIEYVENDDYSNTNSAYSFRLAYEKVKAAPYLHLNCDILFDASLIKEVLASKYSNLLVLDKKIKLTDNMEQVTLNGEKIIKMDVLHYKEAIAKAVGIAKISPQALAWIKNRIDDYIAKNDKKQNFYGIIREVLQIHKFYGLYPVTTNFLYEINNLEDWKKVSFRL